MSFCLLGIQGGTPSPAQAENQLLSLSYWNWAENMVIQSSTSKEDSLANFSGFGVEYEFTTSKKLTGWNWALGIIQGQATGGNKSGNLVYFASYQPYTAFTLRMTRFTRLYPRVYFEAGPLILARSFQWPSGDSLSATSGSSLNYGATFDLRFRLAPQFDFCQSIGFLASQASTLWGLGFGYRF